MAEIIEQSRIPKRTLVDGFKVPAIGLGTFGSDKYNSDQIAEAVYGGIRAGYRMIDCASVYQNENRIGESIERVLKEGIVDRADLFITSKVWNDMHNRVKESCEKSLKDLRVWKRRWKYIPLRNSFQQALSFARWVVWQMPTAKIGSPSPRGWR